MKTKMLVLCALFAALTAAGSLLKIPTPIAPITLQLFFTLMSGILLGKIYGPLSQLIYMLLGLIGLPIFSMGGGIGYILTPSFGFVAGFIACSWLTALLSAKYTRFLPVLLASLCGTALLYIIALPYMFIILNLYQNKNLELSYILYSGMLIYLPGDILKCLLCALIGGRVKLALK